jgi:hypothetical protein
MRVHVHVCISVAVVRGFFNFFFACVMRGYLYIDLKCACMYQWLYMCGFVCIRVSDQCTCLSVSLYIGITRVFALAVN